MVKEDLKVIGKYGITTAEYKTASRHCAKPDDVAERMAKGSENIHS